MDGNPKPLSLDDDPETKEADYLVRAIWHSGGWIRGCLGKQEAPSSSKAEGLFRNRRPKKKIGTGESIPPDYQRPSQPFSASQQRAFGSRLHLVVGPSGASRRGQRTNISEDKIGQKMVLNFSDALLARSA